MKMMQHKWSSHNAILGFLTLLSLAGRMGIDGISFWPRTTLSQDCMNECLPDEEGYTCLTMDGQYSCSPYQNISVDGQACHHAHSCGKHGLQYSWCYLEKGGWDHCSIENSNQLSTDNVVSSTYKAYCLDECARRGKWYHWCNTFRGWDYCSPRWETTTRWHPCSQDHFCDTHGYSYYWCYTKASWDYCSPIADCSYWPAETNRNDDRERCSVLLRDDTVMELVWQRDDSIRQYNHTRLRSASLQAILEWKDSWIDLRKSKSTVHWNKIVRIDFHHYENTTANYRIEINIRLPENETTTIGSVYIPTGITINPRFIRRAFTESINRRKRVTMRFMRRT